MENQISKIIDGKALAKQHEDILREKLASIKDRSPKLVSFVNIEDEPSVKYTGMKAKKARDIGIDFITRNISPRTKFAYLIKEIKKYNADSAIDGIMVQLPIPDGILQGRGQGDILEQINSEKDVDGLRQNSPFLPATVKGVISILEAEGQLGKKRVVRVIGGVRGMVGSALVRQLSRMGERVIGVSRSDPALKTLSKQAQILISAVGQENLITGDMVKDGAVVIDIGKDVDFETVAKKALRITPPIGGVGPMTVISLMENVVESYEID